MRRRWLVVVLVVGLVAAVMVARRSSLSGSTSTSTATPTSTSTATATSTSTTTTTTTIEASSSTSSADAASEGDTRTATIAGVVVDPRGRPVPGETVVFGLAPGGKLDLSQLPFSETETDADGAFSIEVAPGEYLVQVSHDDGPGARAHVRAPALGIRLRLSRGASIDGVLLDADGAPVAAGHVTVVSVGEHESEPPATRYAQTDARGRFRILGLEPGAWCVLAGRQIRGGEEPEVASNTASARLELAPQQAVELALRLGPERTIAGVVVDEAGAALPDARVSAELAVDPLREEGVAHLRADAKATTDARGRFVLEGLADGAHALEVECYGYADPEPARRVAAGERNVRVVLRRLAHLRGRVVGEDGAPIPRFTVRGHRVDAADGHFEVPIERTERMALSITADGHLPLHHTIRVTTGVPADAGDLRLGKARAFRGQVIDADTGAPLAGVRITAGYRSERRLVTYGERIESLRVTDAAGRFTVDDAGDGVELGAFADGYAPALLAIEPGQTAGTLRLARGAHIAVRALDAAGSPIPALMIGILALDGEPESAGTGQTDAAGRFLSRDLAAGTYLVVPLRLLTGGEGPEAGPPGDRPPSLRSRTVTLSAGQTAEVELREATAGATVVVKLAGPGAASPDDFGVALAPGDATHVRTMADALRAVSAGIIAEDRGTTRTFSRIEPGRHTVLVLAGDEDAPSLLARPIEVGAAGEQVIEIEVPAELPPLAR